MDYLPSKEKAMEYFPSKEKIMDYLPIKISIPLHVFFKQNLANVYQRST